MYIIAGKYKKQQLAVPKTDKVRPTTSMARETLFNICQNQIEGSRFLDVFAGSGAMGLEALSRGASTVTFIDNNRASIAAIKENIKKLKVEQEAKVLQLDVFKSLELLSRYLETFDLIYVDPPYGENFSTLVVEFLDSHPLLAKNGSLFVEDTKFEQPPIKNLVLHGERRLGKGHLYEYRFVSRDV